jgi:hypothetical protein
MSSLESQIHGLRERLVWAEAELEKIASGKAPGKVVRGKRTVDHTEEIVRRLQADLAELEDLLAAQREIPSA